MEVTNRANKRTFYAIKFKVLPFKESDKYVCVPYSWIIHRTDERKVLVVYPENEAPFVTNNRVKKREKYNPEWRFYIGFIKFKSETYEEVYEWIEEMITNGGDDQDEEPEIKDPPPEPVGNRQLRSFKNPLWSGTLPDKPQLVVEPYDNPRRPLPKILIRRPLPLRLWKPKQLEPDKLAELAVNTANTVTSKHKQPVIIKGNWLIQSALNGETSNEQSTQSNSKKESVETLVQSRPNLSDKQPPPKPSDDRQPSSVDQGEQPLSIPDINDCDGEIEVEKVQSEHIEEEIPPSKTLTSEQAPQPNSGNERSASVINHKYSLLEARLYEIHTGQPEEANDTQKTSLPQISTVSTTVKLPSKVNQPSQHNHTQPPLPVSIPCSKQLQGTIGISSTQVNHYYQNSHLQGLEKTIPSTIHYKPSAINLSSQRQISVIRKKSSSVNEKPAEKKIRLENITKNIPTQSLNSKQQAILLNYAGSNVGDVIDQSRRRQSMMNTSAAQDLSQLAHQSRFCVEATKLQYLQHMARMQEMFSRPKIPHIDQRTYFQNAMTKGYVSQNQPNQIYQPSLFHVRCGNPRPLVNTNQMQKVLTGYEFLNGSIDKAHSVLAAQKIQSAAQNQQARNLENLQRQHLPIYQDPRTVKPQEVTVERPLAALKTPNQQLSSDRRSYSREDPRLLAKLSRSPIVYHEVCEAVPETTQDSETQTTSSDKLQEIKSKQVPEKNVYQHPCSKKLVVDQATEMESSENETVGSPPEAMDSRYKTDKYLPKEQVSQEIVLDSEMVLADEEVLDNVSTDGSDYAPNEDNCIEEDTSSVSLTEERQTNVHNLIPETQQKHSRMTEQELLKVHSLLLTKMYKNFIYTEEFYNNLRDSTLECLQLYKILLEKSKKVVEHLPTPTSNVMSEVPLVAQERPVAESKQDNSNNCDQNNKSSINNAPTKNRQRHTFVLPSEYDPKDSRWTLKHRNPGPGLTELMPQSRVYVSKKEYKKCIRASNDCRTLARLLLTAVFSRNALSVCSPTGGKARAFITVDIDVRPGLDELAKMVLLAFIEEYGNKHNWNTSDTAGIMSSIRTKIHEMRNKYGKTKVFNNMFYYKATDYGLFI